MYFMENDKIFMIEGKPVTDFETVFRSFYRQLYLYAYSFVMDEMEAEDIVQGVFSVVWEKRQKLPDQLDIRAYLYVSVKHACLRYFQHLKITDQYRQKQAEALLLSFAEETDVDDEVVVNVKKALGKLSAQQEMIVRLHVQDGLKYQEIAEQLNISENTVRTHLKRAYKILREYLSFILPGIPLFMDF